MWHVVHRSSCNRSARVKDYHDHLTIPHRRYFQGTSASTQSGKSISRLKSPATSAQRFLNGEAQGVWGKGGNRLVYCNWKINQSSWKISQFFRQVQNKHHQYRWQMLHILVLYRFSTQLIGLRYTVYLHATPKFWKNISFPLHVLLPTSTKQIEKRCVARWLWFKMIGEGPIIAGWKRNKMVLNIVLCQSWSVSWILMVYCIYSYVLMLDINTYQLVHKMMLNYTCNIQCYSPKSIHMSSSHLSTSRCRLPHWTMNITAQTKPSRTYSGSDDQ